jgi:hypothetical protein
VIVQYGLLVGGVAFGENFHELPAGVEQLSEAGKSLQFPVFWFEQMRYLHRSFGQWPGES